VTIQAIIEKMIVIKAVAILIRMLLMYSIIGYRWVTGNSLLCCHVSANLASAPSIFPAGRTVVFPPKRPELRRDMPDTCTGLMPISSQHRRLRQPYLFGSGVSIDPCEFSTDFFDVWKRSGHFRYSIQTVFRLLSLLTFRFEIS